MKNSAVLSEASDGIVRVTLDRAKVHNAFDDALIAELTGLLAGIGRDPTVHAVVLTGAGKSFSAGADLNWMRRMAGYDEAQNLEDARRLEALLRTLDELPKPTVAMVNGPAIGGGVGLVAACDIAIASDDAIFALSEVRLGLIPAVISPYVVRAMGARACRRYFLTGERFAAAEALRLGLLHEIVPAERLRTRVDELLGKLLCGGPEAQREAKALIRQVRELDGALLGEATARAIAQRRASAEGKEGVKAFLEKRQPVWVDHRTPSETPG